jgi:N12 class adenine-specific DNA methylase
MKTTQLALQFDAPARPATLSHPVPIKHPHIVPIAAGEKAKARDLLAAIRTLKTIETEKRPATAEEKQVLARFAGFGPVALSIFPKPNVSKEDPAYRLGGYKNAGWQVMGEELKALLTPEEYESAKRTTFNQFFTSPTVMTAMHEGLTRLGVPRDSLILEPGCGAGNFMAFGPDGYQFIGVEMDSITGRLAKARFPHHQIRIENFKNSVLPKFDAAIGNVPFADIKLDHNGTRFSLHDYFFAKSVDHLSPGGVLALVTSHFTLDKANASIREYLAERADFLGAIRLPSDAFHREGTSVVTDIVFLRKRAPGQEPHHADPDWLAVAPLTIDGAEVAINKYYLDHPHMVLGQFSRKDTLYGTEGYNVTGNGDLAAQLREAIQRLPAAAPVQASPRQEAPSPPSRQSPGGFTPPLPHISEGSYLVGEDRTIRQIIDGQAVPVVYGGDTLTSYGNKTGKRMAGLLGLRDKARRVLQSQNEGWPEQARQEARRELNGAYDRFTSAYGPINKTTFFETKDGGLIRRMPNLVKFREDPDAMLVMSLEDYDEVTDKATKAAIMQRDVVGRTPPVTHVSSAEEGLLVSLNQRGTVDLPFIASLYGKPENQIIAELGDLIYHDPESTSWQTADAYLSGNVRTKLVAAEKAGPEYTRNAAALKAVQPEDVLPGDIDANLGAPWIPASDIQEFANQLFNAGPDAVRIGHLPKDAVWSAEADYAAQKSVAATSEFGTERANGTWLLELALNMKMPSIYDTVRNDGKEERVLNLEATLAAREKQRQIKDKFRTWIFADPERSERLVRLYNDQFNNLRPRIFDGSHLDFPGMNQTVRLNPHQKDAIWRIMSSGNTLLAHCVGAGKTFEMAAAGMKLKQAGLRKKPMYVVPNHLLEQFAREFQQLYPNARLLVAGKEDFDKERRKLLTAKIASGEWDGILVTHSSFERIGLSRGFQERFLREQIAEYDKLLFEHAAAKGASRNLIKTIEKQKAARALRLKDLLAEEKKDDGVHFEEIGVDHVFIDEAQAYKNLETPTKLERVAGIQTGGSERAFDLLMKCRYLDERHPGHGITFATGTPISNSLGECYTVQRFLDPAGLKSRGIEHFDAWAGTFGEVVESMEIAPDGASLRPRSRFAKFVNLPELQQMFRSFADVQTAEMLNLPRPKLEGGKPIVVACAMSEEQAEMQQQLVARYERLRSQKVDPREDNALAITTDGRKLALDVRMLTPSAGDGPASKVNTMAENIAAIWRQTEAIRGTQMVFCDLGVNPTPWGYSAYDDIIGKLTKRGIPTSEIAVIGDADTDAKKKALFDRVRSGQVRILIGSTQKMGTGTNVQKRLVALHHLDAPWKPAEVEQREGRILRQGNDNPQVAIYRYVTEGSFDAFLWQTLETKAKFIAQIMDGRATARSAHDIGGEALSYAEVKAIASGNPAVLTLAEADAELQKLSILKKTHDNEQFLARRYRNTLPTTIDSLSDRLSGLSADRATAAAHAGDPMITIGSRPLAREDAMLLLGDRLDSLPRHVSQMQRFRLGAYRGLSFGMMLHPQGAPDLYLEGAATRQTQLSREHQGPRAVLNALERLSEGYSLECERVQKDLQIAQAQLRDYQARIGAPFAHDEYLTKLTALRDRLKAGLSAPATGTDDGKPPATAELSEQIKSLMAEHNTAGAAQTVERGSGARPGITAEEPVTARLKRKTETLPASGPAVTAEDGATPASTPGSWAARANAPRIRELG